MVPIHDDFGLDYGYDIRFLAKCGIPRQILRVGMDTTVTGDILTDRNDGPPLGKTQAHPAVVGEPLAECIKTLRDPFAGEASQLRGTLIDLYPGNDPGFFEYFDKRNSVPGRLVDGFVIHDSTAEGIADTWGRDDQLPVSLAVFDSIREADLVEALDRIERACAALR